MAPNRRASTRPPSASSLPTECGLRDTQRPLSHAALYDAIYENRGADVAVYLGLALPCPGQLLELGAGSGRLLSPLLTKGIDPQLETALLILQAQALAQHEQVRHASRQGN